VCAKKEMMEQKIKAGRGGCVLFYCYIARGRLVRERQGDDGVDVGNNFIADFSLFLGMEITIK